MRQYRRPPFGAQLAASLSGVDQPFLTDVPSGTRQALIGCHRNVSVRSRVSFHRAARGVMLAHANLLHNSAIIHRVCAHRLDDKLVFWLPPFHDMGLIAGIVQPVYAGLPAVLMAPASFIQRPMLWLETMSRYGATLSSATPSAAQAVIAGGTSRLRKKGSIRYSG